MKRFFLLAFVLGACLSLSATTTNPGKLTAKKEVIEQQLSDLNQIEKIIKEEGLTYDQLVAKYPNLVEKTQLSASASEDGMFENASGTHPWCTRFLVGILPRMGRYVDRIPYHG